MILANIIAVLLFSLSVDQAHAIVEVDAKFHLRSDNPLNKVYFKAQSGLSLLAADQNSLWKNIAEANVNDIEEEKTLQTWQNMMVYIDLHIGSDQQPYTILFDTGSSWLFLKSRLCDNCDFELSPYFDERNSTTFSFYPVLTDLHYGSGDVYGHVVYDKVCLQPNSTCAQSFSFMAVSHFNLGMQFPVSGLLGMSPRADTQNLLIDQIKANGDIDQKVFSIFIDWEHKNSKISFGGYNLEKYAHPDYQQLEYMTLANPFTTTMWFIYFEGVKMVAPKNATDEMKKVYDRMEVQPNQIVIDSGTSFVLFPQDERDRIVDLVNELNPDLSCSKGQVSICNCPTIEDSIIFPDIRFIIGGKSYFIPVHDYVLWDPEEHNCYNTLLTMPGLNFYIMGLNFFKNYYTVFDQEQMRVGFTISKVAHHRVMELTEEYEPSRNTTSKKNSTKENEKVEDMIPSYNVTDEIEKTDNEKGVEDMIPSMNFTAVQNFEQIYIVEENLESEAEIKDKMEQNYQRNVWVTIVVLITAIFMYLGAQKVKKNKNHVVSTKGEYVVL